MIKHRRDGGGKQNETQDDGGRQRPVPPGDTNRGPVEFAVIRMSGFDIPPLVATIFPFGIAMAILGYYLVWKYLVGFLNELVEIGS